jgi:hypothetical protein
MGKLGDELARSRSTAEEKIVKLTIIWEHQPTADANMRVERAFEMLLGAELDTLSKGYTVEYHNKGKASKESDSNPQVGEKR